MERGPTLFCMNPQITTDVRRLPRGCSLEEVARGENRKKRKTSIHGAGSANRPAKSRAVMMRVDL
jgi:hypothetical protein